jgi:hypothetical protein
MANFEVQKVYGSARASAADRAGEFGMVIAQVPELKPSRIIDQHQELWLEAELAARVVPPIFRQSLRTALFPDF